MVSNPTYDIFDWTQEGMTISLTRLNERQSTRGHSHEKQAEMYMFYSSHIDDVRMVIGDDVYTVRPNDVFYVAPNKFHRVINNTNYPVEFLAFFVGGSQRPVFGK